MCKHIDQTEEFIRYLLENLYPCLELKLQNAINCTYLKNYDEENQSTLIELMKDLRNDFSSLVTCEEKLVFPSVMSVFIVKTAKDVLVPNLFDLMQLTRSKEHKIETNVNYLNSILATHTFKNGAIKQHDLAKSFSVDFVKDKYRWNKMIEDRLISCNCFQSNILYESGVDSPPQKQKKRT